MKFIKKIIFVLLIIINTQSLKGQGITLDGEIFEFATYYISSFN